MGTRPVTVVETAEFQRRAERLFTAGEVEAIKDYIAYNPTAGFLVRGTGGVRKMRFGERGSGKRGGARVIYYYDGDAVPIFLFTACAKAVRDDLTRTQRNELEQVVSEIIETYRGKR
jgi:mRNA-degrading endonuclease RelE of RelBE toxin-antitoxin system